MSLALGIDVGTSSVKVSAVDISGVIAAEVSVSYHIEEPRSGWKQINPEVWWDATCSALKQLSKKCNLSLVSCIGVTGQMHTPVLLDKTGHPSYDSIMWNDLRTKDLVCDAKQAMHDAGEYNIAKILSTGSPALALFWLKQHNLEIYKNTALVFSVPDWIVYKLTGVKGTDISFASTSSLYSIEKNSWSQAALDYFGISQKMLPVVEGSASITGTLNNVTVVSLGLAKGIPVIRGTGDNPASAISAGCLDNYSGINKSKISIPVISLGTSGVLMYSHSGIYAPKVGKTVLFSADGIQLESLIQLSIQSCGNDIDWIVTQILEQDSFSFEDASVEDINYDMRDLLFFPHLNGEKTLFVAPNLRGSFLGLDLSTTRSELYRAVMEGISFGFRQMMDAVNGSDEWHELAVVGGGSKSKLWLEILSNVLDKSIYCLSNVSAGQGSALLALDSIQETNRLSSSSQNESFILRRIDPQRPICDAYHKKYCQYLRIKSAIDTVYSNN
ncbi:xylulokinase [Atopobium fossor]|uniref:xylulokinase n=1 Tax=Atopobium fossor TaxID=39487 RepID=UPI0004251063|nr:FGGY family carbohydrate kinase [Atopobium fossor]